MSRARQKIDKRVPRYGDLIAPTFSALKALGGSGNNDEILSQIIEDLHLTDEVVSPRVHRKDSGNPPSWGRGQLQPRGWCLRVGGGRR